MSITQEKRKQIDRVQLGMFTVACFLFGYVAGWPVGLGIFLAAPWLRFKRNDKAS